MAGTAFAESITSPNCFLVPSKKIHDGNDLSFFLTSKAYTCLLRFINLLNISVYPRAVPGGSADFETWDLDTIDISQSAASEALVKLLGDLDRLIEQAPPETGPRRFGNASFRKWFQLVSDALPELLSRHLTANVSGFPSSVEASALDELTSYLLGSFGSSQRLDYGTGHELSFLAFLGCIWRLGGFKSDDEESQARCIALGVVDRYVVLIRRLITTYTLEPAGSHGVWGLDDHSFLPYIFGSAQLCPPVSSTSEEIGEGASTTDRGTQRPDAPDPASIITRSTVDEQKKKNMYFGAIAFISDVKTGPFWEHSPTLYDISGVRGGWAKINKGMVKMYTVEVLSKFPVVQHFPFGSLFPWEKDDSLKESPASTHMLSQPTVMAFKDQAVETKAPVAGVSSLPRTAAPWAATNRPIPAAHVSRAAAYTHSARGLRDPLSQSGQPGLGRVPLGGFAPSAGLPSGPTQAPWATQAGSSLKLPVKAPFKKNDTSRTPAEQATKD